MKNREELLQTQHCQGVRISKEIRFLFVMEKGE